MISKKRGKKTELGKRTPFPTQILDLMNTSGSLDP